MKYEQICPACSGTGVIYNSAWEAFAEKENKLIKKYISEGMNTRDACIKVWEEMKPLRPNEPEEGACEECDGRGTISTEEGLKLLNFIRKYL